MCNNTMIALISIIIDRVYEKKTLFMVLKSVRVIKAIFLSSATSNSQKKCTNI